MLQGGFGAVDQRDDYLALASGLGFFHQHIIAMHDVVVSHRLSADFKRKDGFVVDNIVQRQAIAIFHRLQRATGGDAAHQGNFEAGGCFALGQHIDGAAVIVGATEQTFSLQVGDVFVDGGQGTEIEPGGNLFKGGRVAAAPDEIPYEIEDFFLSLCDCHSRCSAANERRNCNRIVVDYGCIGC